LAPAWISTPRESSRSLAFTGRQEEIGFDGVLLGVEVVVTAAESVQSLVGAALDDAPRFDDENLVGSSNVESRCAITKVVRRRPDEQGSATLLDQRFRF